MKRVKQNPSREKKAAQAELRRFQEPYDRLKAELAGLGYVCQGTITRRYLPCGKPSCACLRRLRTKESSASESTPGVVAKQPTTNDSTTARSSPLFLLVG